MTDVRDNIVTVLSGNRGTGKTDFLKKLAMATTKPKCLIVDTFDNSRWHDMETYDHPEWEKIKIPVLKFNQLKYWKSGTYRIYSSDFEKMKNYLQKYLRNTFVIMEDATKYFGKTLTTDDRALIYDTKQKNVDAVYVFHSLIRTTKEIVEAADLMTLFHTGDTEKGVEKKYQNPLITQLYNEVEKMPGKYDNATIWIN